MFNHVARYRFLLPNLYLSVADIANPDLFACGSRTWISLDIAGHSAGPHGRLAPKNSNRGPIAGGGRGRHNLHRVCQTAVTAPPRVGCVVCRHIFYINTLFIVFIEMYICLYILCTYIYVYVSYVL